VYQNEYLGYLLFFCYVFCLHVEINHFIPSKSMDLIKGPKTKNLFVGCKW